MDPAVFTNLIQYCYICNSPTTRPFFCADCWKLPGLRDVKNRIVKHSLKIRFTADDPIDPRVLPVFRQFVLATLPYILIDDLRGLVKLHQSLAWYNELEETSDNPAMTQDRNSHVGLSAEKGISCRSWLPHPFNTISGGQ